MISEGSCDSEDWSNDADTSACITGINKKCKYRKQFLWIIIFYNITVFTVVFDQINTDFSKTQNPSNPKLKWHCIFNMTKYGGKASVLDSSWCLPWFCLCCRFVWSHGESVWHAVRRSVMTMQHGHPVECVLLYPSEALLVSTGWTTLVNEPISGWLVMLRTPLQPLFLIYHTAIEIYCRLR